LASALLRNIYELFHAPIQLRWRGEKLFQRGSERCIEGCGHPSDRITTKAKTMAPLIVSGIFKAQSQKGAIMNKHCSGLIVAIVASLTLVTLPTTVKPATLLGPDQVAQIVTVRNVTEKDGTVKGELVNNSRQTIRDIELQILYSWRWKDEFHPGTDDPGRAVYLTINKELPPGQSVGFEYRPSPPLPARKDGYFDINVKVVGFSQVYGDLMADRR
jgi:hypothetical protein